MYSNDLVVILGVQNATSWESAYLQVLGKISMRGRNESGFKRRSVSLNTHLRVLSFSGPREAFKICEDIWEGWVY